MAEDTKIQWCSHTFNPWRGCQKVNAGCTNCYAERDMSVKLHGIGWGTEAQGGTRVRLSDAGWKKPLSWDRAADCDCGSPGIGDHMQCAFCEAGAKRPRVFCGSLCDVFEDWRGPILDHRGNCLSINAGTGGDGNIYSLDNGHPLDDWGCRELTMDDLRTGIFRLIGRTPNLDWMLLTKRPENIRPMIERTVGLDWWLEHCRDNVWLGTSASDQQTADAAAENMALARIDELAAHTFLSLEPMIGPVVLNFAVWRPSLVIVGGESGPNARPCNVEWIRSVVRQCAAAGVACFVKQLGSYVLASDVIDAADEFPGAVRLSEGPDRTLARVHLTDPKGGDPDEWPSDLRVREMP